MAFTVNVRMMLPGEPDNSTSISDQPFIGHYDLQTYGNVNMFGNSFHDPVFSYRSNSHLHIFNASDSSKIYTSDNYKACTVYKWPFTISNDAKLDEFYNAIRGVVAGNPGPIKDGEYHLDCTLKADNVFSKYNYKTTNCFRAVATWLYAMGDYTLKAIYDAAHDGAYMKYSAQKTVEKYADKCTRFYP